MTQQITLVASDPSVDVNHFYDRLRELLMGDGWEWKLIEPDERTTRVQVRPRSVSAPTSPLPATCQQCNLPPHRCPGEGSAIFKQMGCLKVQLLAADDPVTIIGHCPECVRGFTAAEANKAGSCPGCGIA